MQAHIHSLHTPSTYGLVLFDYLVLLVNGIDIVSTKNYDESDDFDFEIVNFQF